MANSIWAQKSGDTFATPYAGDATGRDAAYAYVSGNGHVSFMPGTEAVGLGTVPSGVTVDRVGAGAIHRIGDTYHRGRPWFDGRAFGAKGDNATDDTGAIQAALTAAVSAGGGIVYLPPGTYRTTAELSLNGSNVKVLLAPGATVKAMATFTGSSPALLQIGDNSTAYSNITVEGGKWDGNLLATYCIIALGPLTNAALRFAEITGSLSTSVDFRGIASGTPITGVLAEGCYVHDTYEGIQAVDATDVRFIGNHVVDMTGSGGPQDCLEIATRVNRFVVANNTCRNPGPADSCIDIFEDCHDGLVVNNVCTRSSATGTSYGITMAQNTVPCSRVIIAGNAIAGGFQAGISLSAGQSDVLIANNTIRDGNLANSSMGIEVNDCDDVLITGNRVSRMQSACVVLGSTNNRVAVINNDLADPWLGSTGINSHVYIGNAGATAITIRGNRMWHTGSGVTFNISNTAGATVLVEDNDMGGIAGGGRPIENQNDSGLTVRRNRGFVTENNGTATIASGTTSIAVNHGLGRTPALEDISVTGTNNPTNAPGHVWISGVGATQFTINCAANPGTGGATFVWTAAIV